MRTITENEDQQLAECLRHAGVLDLDGLVEFCKANAPAPTTISLEISDLRIREYMPLPGGKDRESLVHIINVFIDHSKETGNYPRMTEVMSKKTLSFKLASLTGLSKQTATGRIDQLIALGWCKNHYGGISNPVAYYHRCQTEGVSHPGVK
jgi:hypothetical protein